MCIMMIYRYMCLAISMPSWCNAVGVVLLIAQGWRGTSLPWAIENAMLIALKWIYQMIVPFSLTKTRTEILKKNP